VSTTPPEPPQQGYTGIGRSPVSGIVEVVLAIVAAVSNRFDATGWAVATTWLTAAYILSRGIAKASRVLEQ
jgi:hypothetical protein